MKFTHFLLLGYLAIVSYNSIACPYHGQANFAYPEIYPGSHEVEVATQHAIANQSLAAVSVLPEVSGFQRMRWWLTLLPQKHALPKSSHVYIIEWQVWGTIADEQNIEIHRQAPEPGSPVLVLSEVSLHALVKEHLDLQQAIDSGFALQSVHTDAV